MGCTVAHTRPWVHYVDTWPFFSDSNLQFQHSLPMADGEVKGLRQKDDIHFSDVGGARMARLILEDLKAYIDMAASKVPTPPPDKSAPPEIKERTEVPENMPGAV